MHICIEYRVEGFKMGKEGSGRGLKDSSVQDIWGLSQIRGTFLGVPIVRSIIFWGLHWGPPVLGKYYM